MSEPRKDWFAEFAPVVPKSRATRATRATESVSHCSSTLSAGPGLLPTLDADWATRATESEAVALVAQALPTTAQAAQVEKSFEEQRLSNPVARVALVAHENRQHAQSAEFEERAALIEDGASVLREWAEGFARLDLARAIPGFTERRWRRMIDDGGRFLDRWGNEAARLGWSAEDVFGVHPAAPAARFDQMGLAPLIGGGEVVAIDETSATIRTPGGAIQTYRRVPMPDSIAIWTLTSR